MPKTPENQKLGQFERNFPHEFMAMKHVLCSKLTAAELMDLTDIVFEYGVRRASQERAECIRTGVSA